MNKTIELSTEELRSIVGGKCTLKGLDKALIKGLISGPEAAIGGSVGYLATCWW